ncbi:MAG: putative conserved rane protein [Bacillales bacterium]|jgi:uncharacterized membrane protein YdjX (TVP38/TMEM64 family)|nr:putative conserved rane protein [Bacillales bacterium]
MDFLKEWFTYQHLLKMLHEYESLGVIFGLLFPFLESFLPIFPFVVIITVNVAAYGFWPGFLVSWLGGTIGSLLLFYLTRRFGKNTITKFLYRPGKKHPIMNWIGKAGFGPIFIILCFPFTPSFFVTLFAAVSLLRASVYVPAVIFGKFVMVLSVATIGKDVVAFRQHPEKTIILVLLMIVLWGAGKIVEKRISAKQPKKV